MFPLPEQWKSKRHKIIEVYARTRSVSKTAKELGYKTKSFVRSVISEYREIIRTEQQSSQQEVVASK